MIDAQIRKANEELGELIVAMSHYFGEDRIYKEKLAEEIADVEIVCSQLRHLIGDFVVDEQKHLKMKRLRERIDKCLKSKP
jgi:NTP pyrophosphatase (non-canonical NTP hydrolase)